MATTTRHASGFGSGIFISFEGGEGAGKSTHINFLAETLKNKGYRVLCLREPGGTVIGEKLRSLVLDTAHSEISDETELFIYEAARSQLVSEVIQPALLRGEIVLCDRFADSTLAYQAYGRGLSRAFVLDANAFASQGVIPDRTILLSCGGSVQEGLERATHDIAADRVESAGEDFHARVNEGFMDIARDNPDRIRAVSSSDLRSQTSRAIFAELVDLFPWMNDDEYQSDEFFTQLDIKHYGNKQRRADDDSSGTEATEGDGVLKDTYGASLHSDTDNDRLDD